MSKSTTEINNFAFEQTSSNDANTLKNSVSKVLLDNVYGATQDKTALVGKTGDSGKENTDKEVDKLFGRLNLSGDLSDNRAETLIARSSGTRDQLPERTYDRIDTRMQELRTRMANSSNQYSLSYEQYADIQRDLTYLAQKYDKPQAVADYFNQQATKINGDWRAEVVEDEGFYGFFKGKPAIVIKQTSSNFN